MYVYTRMNNNDNNNIIGYIEKSFYFKTQDKRSEARSSEELQVGETGVIWPLDTMAVFRIHYSKFYV